MGAWRLGLVALVAALPGLAAGQDAPPQLGEVPELIAELKASYDSRSWNAAHRLARLGAAAVPALVEVLRDRTLGSRDGVHQPARYQAAFALKDMGPSAGQAVPTLLGLVRDASEDEGVRWASAAALGSIGEQPSEVVPALVALLEGRPSSLGFYALGGLGDLAQRGGEARQAVAAALPALHFADWRYGEVGGFPSAFAAIYREVEAPSPAQFDHDDDLRAAALRDRLLALDLPWCLSPSVPDAVVARLADLGVSRERDDCMRVVIEPQPRRHDGAPWFWRVSVGRVTWRSNHRAQVATSANGGFIPSSVEVHVLELGPAGWWVVKREGGLGL